MKTNLRSRAITAFAGKFGVTLTKFLAHSAPYKNESYK